MSEDQKDPKYVKPSGDSAPGAEPSQPTEPVLPGDRPMAADDLSPHSGEPIDSPLERFTGTLRGDPSGDFPPAAAPDERLQDEDVLPRNDYPEEPGPSKLTTGSLLQRLTGSLRRSTGSLRHTGPVREHGTRPLSEDDLRDAAGPLRADNDQPAEPGSPASASPVPDAPTAPDLSKQGTGSLLERLTGTLRHTTGSLRRVEPPQDTGALRHDELPQETQLPRRPEPSGDTELLRQDDLQDTGSLRQVTGPLPHIDLPQDTGPLRREDLADSVPPVDRSPDAGLPRRADLSEDTDRLHASDPVHSTGPMHDSGHLRGTRPLSEGEVRDLTDAAAASAAPSRPAAAGSDSAAGRLETPGEVDPRMHIASPEDEPGPSKTGPTGTGSLGERPGNTGSLLERLTGTLRRTTGELLGTGSLRRTGPLRGEPGKEAEGGAKSRRPVLDESLVELRQSLTSEEAEQAKRGRGTGRLIERITGSLRKVTGSLRKTDKLRAEGAAEAAAEAAAAATAAAAALPGAAAAEADDYPAAEASLSEMPEIGDDMLAGRLGGAEATAPRDDVPGLPSDWSESPWFTGVSEVEPAQEEEGLRLTDEPLVDWENSALPEVRWSDEDVSDAGYPAAETDLSEPVLSGDEPISLLDSGAIAALGQAEAEEQQTRADWLSEIRHEVAEEEETSAAESEDKPRRKGMTGQLRSFISNILRGGENREKTAGKAAAPEAGEGAAEAAAAEAAAADAGAASTAGAETVELQSDEEWQAYIAASQNFAVTPEDEAALDEHLSSLFGEETAAEELAADSLAADALAAQEELDDEAFAARFGVLGEAAGDQPAAGDLPLESTSAYELSPEDEALLWGPPTTLETPGSGPVTLPSPDELWEAPQQEGEAPEFEPPAPDLRDQQGDIESLTLRSEERLTGSLFGATTDDAYAAAFLTGSDIVPIDQSKASQDNLLREALGRAPEAPEAGDAFEDLRSIVLEDYEEAAEGEVVEAEQQTYQVPIELEPVAVTPAEEEALGLNEPMPVQQNWWTARTLVEKVLIVEAAVVALVLLIAVPFYTFLVINRVHARQALVPAGQVAAPSFLVPRPLPADLPYPTGMVLPGGWYFALSKSTFVEGTWKPASSEWLEGTELPRAVALPWNAQTEAVIRTFKAGDRVKLDLSNSKSLVYKIDKIERVPVSNTTVLTDTKYSLVVILYKENAEERWVVFCKP